MKAGQYRAEMRVKLCGKSGQDDKREVCNSILSKKLRSTYFINPPIPIDSVSMYSRAPSVQSI